MEGPQPRAAGSKGKAKASPPEHDADNRTDTPEISKDQGVENPDKDIESVNQVAMETALEVVSNTTNEDHLESKTEDKDVGHIRDEPDTVAGNMTKVNIGDAGTGRFVDETLDRQRENEKMAFRKLIDENVKTENKLRKVSQELVAVKASQEAAEAEVVNVIEQNKTLRLTIHNLERDLGEMKAKGDVSNRGASGTSAQEDNEVSGQTSVTKNEFITTERKLEDLQLRLKRMAKDEEEKDSYILDLTKQVKELEETLSDAEHLVDGPKWEEMLEKRAGGREPRQGDNIAIEEHWSRDNVVNSADRVHSSKICVIM